MVTWVSCASGLEEWGDSAVIVERLQVVVRASRGRICCVGPRAALRACASDVWVQAYTHGDGPVSSSAVPPVA